jgi:hypothetical protein
MNRPELLAFLLAVAAVAFQTFLPPAVGLANNGDFPKVIGRFDVGNPSDDKDVFRFADVHYVIDPRYHWESPFYSSEALLFATAFGVNVLLGNLDSIDIRLLGAVHAGLFLLAFYLFLPVVSRFRPALRSAVLLMALLMFTDVMYVSYFNSFFMDTAAFLFLLLSVVSFLRALIWRRSADRWMFVVSAVLMITSKTQHYPLGIPIALLLAWKGGLLIPATVPTRPTLTFRTVSVASVLTATAFSGQFETPSNYPAMGAYTVIFYELLPQSKTVASDLNELGLDESYQRYVGTHAYSDDAGLRDPKFAEAFVRKDLYSHLAWYFVKHPRRALETIVLRLDEAGRQRPPVGNYERLTGFPEFTESQSFALWSDLKARLFSQHGGLYLLYSLLLALCVPLLAVARRAHLPTGLPLAVGTVSVMLLLELLVASFADALDPERQYSLFSMLTDLLLICGVCLTAVSAKAWWNSLEAGWSARLWGYQKSRVSANERV